MKIKFTKYVFFTITAATLVFTGCKKEMLETESGYDKLYSYTDNTAGLNTLLNGIHTLFTYPGASYDGRAYDWGQKSIDMALDLMGEDIVPNKIYSNLDWFKDYYNYRSTESPRYWMAYHMWRFYYRLINNTNVIINSVDAATGPDSEKKSIKGQALALRAYAYYRLVNNYAPHILSPNGPQQLGVPLYLKVVEGSAEFPPRSSVQQIYDQIFADLEQSIVELSTGATPRINKSHLDVSVVEGLKARIALNAGRYSMAAEAANNAKSNYPLMSAQQLLNGFNNSNNTEFMWTSQLTTEQMDFRRFSNFMSWMDPKTPGYAGAGISLKITYTLYNLIDDADIRKQHFEGPVDKFQQKKFWVLDPSSFHYDDLFMRSAEMYLIQAEALARLNPNDATAKQLLNELMQNRLSGYDASTAIVARNNNNTINNNAKALLGLSSNAEWTLLEEIKLQRKIELWGEGLSYEDMKRYQNGLNRPIFHQDDHSPRLAEGVITLGANDRKFIFRIPQQEIDLNPNIIQNP